MIWWGGEERKGERRREVVEEKGGGAQLLMMAEVLCFLFLTPTYIHTYTLSHIEDLPCIQALPILPHRHMRHQPLQGRLLGSFVLHIVKAVSVVLREIIERKAAGGGRRRRGGGRGLGCGCMWVYVVDIFSSFWWRGAPLCCVCLWCVYLWLCGEKYVYIKSKSKKFTARASCDSVIIGGCGDVDCI